VHMEGVGKDYPHFTLDDITLSLPADSIMGFIGANGAGKSTTMRILMGLVHQDRGSVHVLGHSFGGLVARAAVIAEPELFASIVLLSSGPAGLGGARRAQIEMLEPVLATAGLAAVYAGIQAVNRAEPGYVEPPPELADFYERRFLTSSAAGLQGMGVAVRDEPDRVAELAATGVRSLVTCGEDDDAWPPDLQRAMAARLGAPFVLIPDAAHSAATENPTALTAELVSFWR